MTAMTEIKGHLLILTLLCGAATTVLADDQLDMHTSDRADALERDADAAGAVGAATDAEAAPADADNTAVAATPSVATVYVPPRRGAPKTRVGGGTRSAGSNVQLAVLAPEHTGLTAQPAPELYWWLSEDHAGPFEFVVIREDGIEPALRFRSVAPLQAGIHRFDLEAAGLALEAGVAYRWSVAIIRDEDRRARDIVALATVEYIHGDGLLSGGAVEDATSLAAAGLWYDALAAANREADQSAQVALLEQVALPEVAAWKEAEQS
ncbi:MAG: DUF928 domain-containing protein [Pseudomonadota bacterium]